MWDKIARDYHTISLHSRAHQQKFARLAQLIMAKKPSNLIDLGCGSGVLEATLLKAQYQGKITALEYSNEMLKIARSFVQSKQVVFGRYDLNQPWPFEDSSFDCAVAVNVMIFMDNPSFFVKELKRITTPDALILIVNPQPRGSLRNFFKAHFSGLNLWEKLREFCRLIVLLPSIVRLAAWQNSLDKQAARSGQFLAKEQTIKIFTQNDLALSRYEPIQAGQNWLYILKKG